MLLGASAVLACAVDAPDRDDAPAERHARVDTIGDTIHVHSPAGSGWRAARLEQELRIGAVDGEDHEIFGRVGALAVAADGTMLIYDTQAVALRRYAADGSYLGTIGRSGSGPGEYRGISGVAVLADGRIAALDAGNGRYNIYAADGTPLDTWTAIRPAVFLDRPLYPAPGGGVYHFEADRAMPASPGAEDRRLIVLDADGRPGDTLRIPPPSAERPAVEVRAAEVSAGSYLPFAPRHDWSVTSAGELVGGFADRYSIDVHRRDGSVLRLSRAHERVAVTAGESAAEEERITTLLRRVEPGWRWSGPAIPSEKPAFTALHTAADGRIWVELPGPGKALAAEERRPAARSWVREDVAFDVFESDGRYVGRVETPAGFLASPRPVFRGDHVWAVVRDADGVNFVARYRVRSGG
jgi:hypothetical protein